MKNEIDESKLVDYAPNSRMGRLIKATHEEGLIGQKASHGCIRMFNHDVIELFELIPLETLVDIEV